MVEPRDPQSIAARVRRLELMLTALIFSLGDEVDDEDFWFEFRRFLLRSERKERSDFPDLAFFLERQINRRRMEKEPSMLRQLEEVRSEVAKLKSRTESIEIDTHTLLAPPASGKLSTRFDPSTRGPNRRP
jgi:hypothetical protein